MNGTDFWFVVTSFPCWAEPKLLFLAHGVITTRAQKRHINLQNVSWPFDFKLQLTSAQTLAENVFRVTRKSILRRNLGLHYRKFQGPQNIPETFFFFFFFKVDRMYQKPFFLGR